MTAIGIGIGIDFALENVLSLTKWMVQKTADAVSKRTEDILVKESQKSLVVALDKKDFDILQKAIDVLKSDSQKVATMFGKQAKAELMASWDLMERGIILLHVCQKFGFLIILISFSFYFMYSQESPLGFRPTFMSNFTFIIISMEQGGAHQKFYNDEAFLWHHFSAKFF